MEIGLSRDKPIHRIEVSRAFTVDGFQLRMWRPGRRRPSVNIILNKQAMGQLWAELIDLPNKEKP